MEVTKFGYALDKLLIEKLDKLINRCIRRNPKDDVVLICEGAEGIGKTSASVAIAYYVSEKTGRPFSHTHLFFDSDKMLEFSQSTQEQIIIWDEPATDSLSTDWAKKSLQNLIRLLMTARNKRHFIIMNMTRFYRFKEDIAVDRAIGMIHLYRPKRRNETHFRYIPHRKIEGLFREYKFRKKRSYKKFSSKICRGSMPDVLNPDYKHNVLSEFNYPAYELMKNDAILNIGKSKAKEEDKEKEEKDHKTKKLEQYQQRIQSAIDYLQKRGLNNTEIAVAFDYTPTMITKIKEISKFSKLKNAKPPHGAAI